jgi:antitoxin (DNA-binding transcriptional repressor) of toxin-antitoxin stability system
VALEREASACRVQPKSQWRPKPPALIETIANLGATGHIIRMKSIAVHEVRKQWSKVLREHAGREVPVTSRGAVVAYLRVPSRKKTQKVQLPDFKSRIKARFGDRMLGVEDVRWLDEASKSRI